MDAGELAAYATAAAALGALLMQARRASTDRRKTAAETDADAITAMRGVLAEMKVLRDELELSRDQEEDCQARVKERDVRIGTLLAELSLAMQRAVAVEQQMREHAVTEKVIARNSSVVAALDQCHDGIVLSSVRDGGTFEWVNKTFAEALGYAPEEIIALGWRNLCHPADVARMQELEAAAIGESGEARNRYRHRDGHYVAMRWLYSGYGETDNQAFSVVWLRRRRTDAG